jgi:ParB family chromosome partitioning protein
MTEMIPLSQITRNPGQPRETFPKEHIERLAASIKARGLIQAITVRRVAPERYIIVAGECRYRAHQLLGRSEIKADVVEIDEREMTLRAIVENLQRQDMNPMEEAKAFSTLVEQGMTKNAIAAELGVGVDRIQNRLNLLDLLPEVQRMVAVGTLSTSTASAIALSPHEHQLRIVREINNGTLRTVDQIRHAGQALRDAADQIDAFADAPIASEAEVEAVRELEQRIESVARMVIAGFDEGRCVAANRVAPDRVRTMADRLLLIRKHVLQMEHQLRCVLAQLEITTGHRKGRSANENSGNQTALGVADRQRTKGRREPNVVDTLPRAVARPRLRAR